MLDDHRIAASLGEDAEPWVLVHPPGEGRIEYLDEILPDVFPDPLIEDTVQEPTVLTRYRL